MTNTGEDPDAVLKRLQRTLATQEDRYRLIVAFGERAHPDLRARTSQLRNGFPHLRLRIAKGASEETVTRAFPTGATASTGSSRRRTAMWMRFKVARTQSAYAAYRRPARSWKWPRSTARFVDGKWSRASGGELGVILQLDSPTSRELRVSKTRSLPAFFGILEIASSFWVIPFALSVARTPGVEG